MKTLRFLSACFALTAWSGCIVDQNLGDRSDASDRGDAVTQDTSTTAPDAGTSDAPSTGDAPARVDAPPSDAPPGDVPPSAVVQAIDISLARGHVIPALSPTPSVSVQVTFRSGAIEPERVLREVARGGDCVAQQPQPRALTPASPLGALRVTASPEGGAPVTLTPSTMVRGAWVIAEYTAELGALSPGARVRIDVGATASSPEFSRDVEVSDVEYAAPTPVTDTAMARYLTWTPGSPLEVYWRRSTAAPTTVGFTFNLFTTAGEAYSLVCTSAAAATHLTVPASVLGAFRELSPSMGVGGVTNILTASAPTRSQAGAVEVTTSTGSFTVSGTRW